MRKSNKYIALFLGSFIFLSSAALAQSQQKVSGYVLDSLNNPIEGASIKLITEKDTLKANSDHRGHFSFSKIPAPKFYLQVSGVGYRPFASIYELSKTEKNKTLSPVILKSTSIRLEDVTIKVKVEPIRIKKDTIEYNAAAYTIRQNDKVEDLLKQLQGIDVDENGAVKAMGKTMTKLRVNGEDFFTSNVQDYIRQLPADIIAKIQVIDDYGDQANFTGIKTGAPQKMLNLVTKPDVNRGVFGNAVLTSGTNKSSIASTNGNVWKDNKQVGFGGNYNFTDNAYSKINRIAVNANMRSKISDKLSVNGNYTMSNGLNRSYQLNYLETYNPQGVIEDLREVNSKATTTNNSLNLGVVFSGQNNYVNATLSGVLSDVDNVGSSSSNKTGYIKQDLYSESGNRQQSPNINAAVNWSGRLSNTKNSLSVGINVGQNENNFNNSINDIIRYYNATTSFLVKDSLLNRLVSSRTQNTTVGGNIQFANALQDKNDANNSSFLTLSYSFSLSRTQSLQNTSTKDAAGNTSPIDSLGLNYVSDFINQNINMGYSRNSSKVSYTMGFSFMPSIILGYYKDTGQHLKNHQLNFSPNINLSYLIKENQSLSFGYNGSARSPDYNKLQPVKNSQDVQNIVVGNPNLKASFNHLFSINYNQNDLKSGNTIMLALAGSITQNSVVSNTILITDTLGSLKQRTTYENVNGIYNVGLNYSLYKRMLDNKLRLSANGNVAYSHNVFYTDNVLNSSTGINLSNTLAAGMYQKTYSFNVSGSYAYSSNTYSISNQNIKNIQTVGLNANGTWLPDPKFKINASVSKNLNLGFKLNAGNPLLVNLGVNRNFLKNDALTIGVQANDLFNQGTLFKGTVDNNSINENRTQFISRFVRATVTYYLNRFDGKKGEKRPLGGGASLD